MNNVAKCSDFFAAADNHKHHIFEPLRRVGIEYIVTAFHTFTSGSKARDQALVDFLKPAAYHFDKSFNDSPRIVDSYIRVIDLLMNSKENGVDIALLVRFDLFFLKPLDWLYILWDKVNFRDRDWDWICRSDSECDKSDLHFTSDLFYLTPNKFLPALRSSLDASGSREPVTDDHKWLQGSGHWAYDPLATRIGAANINFITGGWRTSMSDASSVCDWAFNAGMVGFYSKDEEPIGVLRVCPLGNVSEPVLQACINWKHVVNGSQAVGMSMQDGFGLQAKPLGTELGDDTAQHDGPELRDSPRRKSFFDKERHALQPHTEKGAAGGK